MPGTAGAVLGDLLLENGAVVVDTSPSPVPSSGFIGLMLVASLLLTLGSLLWACVAAIADLNFSKPPTDLRYL